MPRRILPSLLVLATVAHAHAAERVDAQRQSRLSEAKSLQAAGNFPAAIRVYETLLTGNANDPLVIYELAFSHQMSRAWQPCITYARRGIAIESEHQAGSHAVLALCQEGSGRRADALATYKAATEKFPRDYRARYNYALGLAAEGKLPEAMIELQASITAEPRYAPAYLTYGKMLDTYRRDGVATCMYLVFIMLESQTPNTREAAARIAMILDRQVSRGNDGKPRLNVTMTPGSSAQENALAVALATAALNSGVGDPAVPRERSHFATLDAYMKVAGDLAGKEQSFYSSALLTPLQRLNAAGRQAEFLRLALGQTGAGR